MNQESGFTRLLHRVKNEDSDTKPFSPFIYMVPSVLRKVNPSSFNPWLVSIGPLHREDENVQAFEGQKVSYIIDLMNRFKAPQEEILESCNTKAYALMNRIKASYIWPKTPFSDAEIVEMMVMDACFIIGFMIKVYTSVVENSYPRKELQFTTIMHDLLLLENQIPLFFLDEMFQCTRSILTTGLSLLDLIHSQILSVYNLFKADLKVDNISMGTNDHILSLLHQCYAPPNNIKKDKCNIIPSVADLDMAGVSFKPSEDKTWVMGIEVKQYRFLRFYRFWKKHTLTMPVLKVHDSTEFLIRNLIAYEQSFQDQRYVTSYAAAMDELINTADDVAKLIDSGVLINVMGSNEEAANMINNLGKNVICNDSYYEEEWVKLNEYCNRWWPKRTASFRRTYLIYPWKFVALIAGIVLFVLQVVQTIYTIRSS